MPAPACQPCLRLRRWCVCEGENDALGRSVRWGPVTEPVHRAAAVDRGRGAPCARRARSASAVLPIIEENVDERVLNFARCLQRVAMMAIAKEAPAPPRDGVHRERDAREERAHLVREVDGAASFDHEVEMVLLHGVVKNAHALALRSGDDTANRRTHELSTKARPQRDPPDRHVHRMILVMRSTRLVRHEPDPLRFWPPPKRNQLPVRPAPPLPTPLSSRTI